MPQSFQTVLSLAFGAIAVIWVAFALRKCLVERSLVPLYLVLGGALAICYEPVGDTLEMAFYPPHGQMTWVSLFGRHVPVFIGVSFFFYFGVAVWLFDKVGGKGFSKAGWWGLFLGLAFSRVVQDEILLSFGEAWIYYGPQPFQFRFFPLWVAFPTSVFQVVTGAGVHAIVNKLPARQHWVIVPAIPLLFLIGHACAVFPSTLALYNTTDPLLLHVGAVASVTMSCLMVWIIGKWFIVPAARS